MKLKVTRPFQLFHHKPTSVLFWVSLSIYMPAVIFLSYLFHKYSISHKCQVNIMEMKLLRPEGDLKLLGVSCLAGKVIFWKQERESCLFCGKASEYY